MAVLGKKVALRSPCGCVGGPRSGLLARSSGFLLLLLMAWGESWRAKACKGEELLRLLLLLVVLVLLLLADGAAAPLWPRLLLQLFCCASCCCCCSCCCRMRGNESADNAKRNEINF